MSIPSGSFKRLLDPVFKFMMPQLSPHFRFLVFFAVFLVGNSNAKSQEYSIINPVPAEKMRPMTTERPSRTISSYIVDIGHLQVETTLYSLTRNTKETQRSKEQSVFNSTTLRFGITNSSEVSVVMPSMIWQRTRDVSDGSSSNIRSHDDTTLRFKQNIFGGDPTKNGGSMALMPYLKVPTAGKNLGNDAYEGGLKTHYDYNFDEYSISYLFDVAYVKKTAGTGRTAWFANVLDVEKNFTSDFCAYTEFASYKTLEQGTAAQNYLDFGVIYQLSKNTKVDIITNFGVSKAADDFIFSTGFSHRF